VLEDDEAAHGRCENFERYLADVPDRELIETGWNAVTGDKRCVPIDECAVIDTQ
jgi:hypothetical protein